MDYYKILQVDPKASQDVIKGAYRVLAKKYHPDCNTGDKAEAEARMKQINAAYTVLCDERTRREYDRQQQENTHVHQASHQKASQAAYTWASPEEPFSFSGMNNSFSWGNTAQNTYQDTVAPKWVLFKIITTLASIILLFAPGVKGYDWSDVILWAAPVFAFGTLKGVRVKPTSSNKRIGIIWLQIVMPLCGYIGLLIIRDFNSFVNSVGLLLLVYGGGLAAYLRGMHYIEA